MVNPPSRDASTPTPGGHSDDRPDDRPNDRRRRPAPPLDAAALDRLALRYVERFQTTRGKLSDYLRRKIRERGWVGPAADPAAVAERMAGAGYVDDAAYAGAKAAAMGRRGLGARRIHGALRQAHVGEAEMEGVAPAIADDAVEAALRFARRRRIGPWARAVPDRPEAEKQLAAMLRAGHAMTLSRRIVALEPGSEPELYDRLSDTR